MNGRNVKRSYNAPRRGYSNFRGGAYKKRLNAFNPMQIVAGADSLADAKRAKDVMVDFTNSATALTTSHTGCSATYLEPLTLNQSGHQMLISEPLIFTRNGVSSATKDTFTGKVGFYKSIAVDVGICAIPGASLANPVEVWCYIVKIRGDNSYLQSSNVVLGSLDANHDGNKQIYVLHKQHLVIQPSQPAVKWEIYRDLNQKINNKTESTGSVAIDRDTERIAVLFHFPAMAATDTQLVVKGRISSRGYEC